MQEALGDVQLTDTGVLLYLPTSNAIRFIPVVSPPEKPSVVFAIDVANYQATDLTEYFAKYPIISHVVVHLAVHGEREDPAISLAQINSARENGRSAGGCMFCYPGLDPVDSVNSALAIFPNVPVLWLDIETYLGQCIDAQWIDQAVYTANAARVRVGIYTSASIWKQYLGNTTSFGYLPLWLANWDGDPELAGTLPPGWTTLAGHQYGSSDLDYDVFERSVTE